MDRDYNFQINLNIELEKQNISKEANATTENMFSGCGTSSITIK